MNTKLPVINAETRWLQTELRDINNDVVARNVNSPLCKFQLETKLDFEAVNINGQWFVSAKLLPPFMHEQFEQQWNSEPDVIRSASFQSP